jgi:hypothetical protein
VGTQLSAGVWFVPQGAGEPAGAGRIVSSCQPSTCEQLDPLDEPQQAVSVEEPTQDDPPQPAARTLASKQTMARNRTIATA